MAINMTGEETLPATRDVVWQMLNDPKVLQACIPGCEMLEWNENGGLNAVARVKIGPVKARFKGQVSFEDVTAPSGYRIVGEGNGGISGFAKGGARVDLEECGEATILRYEAEAHVGGKLAQLGSRLVDGVAKKMADEFFRNFAAAVRETS
jgi:uncharacterized protein